jgi:hypothetical protein
VGQARENPARQVASRWTIRAPFSSLPLFPAPAPSVPCPFSSLPLLFPAPPPSLAPPYSLSLLRSIAPSASALRLAARLALPALLALLALAAVPPGSRGEGPGLRRRGAPAPPAPPPGPRATQAACCSATSASRASSLKAFCAPLLNGFSRALILSTSAFSAGVPLPALTTFRSALSAAAALFDARFCASG